MKCAILNANNLIPVNYQIKFAGLSKKKFFRPNIQLDNSVSDVYVVIYIADSFFLVNYQISYVKRICLTGF